jgi:hypothetical protein
MRNNPFTPGFQRRLLAMLLQMPGTYSQYNDVWHPTYFDDPSHRKIVHAYMHVRLVGTEQPTQVSLSQELRKRCSGRLFCGRTGGFVKCRRLRSSGQGQESQ